MSLTSNLFILFVFITVVLYYILPHKIQWLVLLAASYVYYIYSGPRYVYFILFSTLCSYLCGRLIEKFAENKDENGKTGNVSGKWVDHGWVEINGAIYDPDLEYELGYNCFGQSPFSYRYYL